MYKQTLSWQRNRISLPKYLPLLCDLRYFVLLLWSSASSSSVLLLLLLLFLSSRALTFGGRKANCSWKLPGLPAATEVFRGCGARTVEVRYALRSLRHADHHTGAGGSFSQDFLSLRSFSGFLGILSDLFRSFCCGAFFGLRLWVKKEKNMGTNRVAGLSFFLLPNRAVWGTRYFWALLGFLNQLRLSVFFRSFRFLCSSKVPFWVVPLCEKTMVRFHASRIPGVMVGSDFLQYQAEGGLVDVPWQGGKFGCSVSRFSLEVFLLFKILEKGFKNPSSCCPFLFPLW